MSTHPFPDLPVEDDAPNAPCVAAKIESIGNTHWQIKSSLLYPASGMKNFLIAFRVCGRNIDVDRRHV